MRRRNNRSGCQFISSPRYRRDETGSCCACFDARLLPSALLSLVVHHLLVLLLVPLLWLLPDCDSINSVSYTHLTLPTKA